MKYVVLTRLCTNLLLSIFSGPLFLAFTLVIITIAVAANLSSRKVFSYKQAILTGNFITLTGSPVSAPIRLIMFGGVCSHCHWRPLVDK